jgi:predicted HAD superfamily Cof-like phosphohydrolase
MKTVDDVAAFHTKFGVPVLATPQLPSVKRMRLRAKLITEEYLELMRAMGWPVFIDQAVFDTYPADADLIGVADGCTDLKYVTIGTEHEYSG